MRTFMMKLVEINIVESPNTLSATENYQRIVDGLIRKFNVIGMTGSSSSAHTSIPDMVYINIMPCIIHHTETSNCAPASKVYVQRSSRQHYHTNNSDGMSKNEVRTRAVFRMRDVSSSEIKLINSVINSKGQSYNTNRVVKKRRLRKKTSTGV